ncbi:MAG: efflux RND transporter periplasmic adaptor subunit [Planctomycetes bacterium]|nr:efflux RND transporter periplasmic adaptor subunit [Planctomycetota bacterium]
MNRATSTRQSPRQLLTKPCVGIAEFRDRAPLIALVLFSAALISACGCDDRTTAGGPPSAKSEHGKGMGRGSPARPPVPVAVVEAKVGPISSHYTATATLEVEKQAEVLARVTGIVKALDVEEGDAVEEGDRLVQIENAEYRYQLEKAVANASNLRTQFDRLSEAKSLVSIEEFETLQNNLATATAEEELCRLNLSYTSVAAPFSGQVVRRYIDVGHNVSEGTPLFAVADFEPLLARVHVPAKEFKQLQIDQKVDLVLDSNGERLHGRVTLVSPTIDPSTGTIKVTLEISEYPDTTRPGDFAEVQIVTEKHLASTLIPKNAVVTDKGEQVSFVAVNGKAERRVVEAGFTDDLHAEILRGIAPNEYVVVKGQRSLKHGDVLKVLDGPTPAVTTTQHD